jgi:hypothetical protein
MDLWHEFRSIVACRDVRTSKRADCPALASQECAGSGIPVSPVFWRKQFSPVGPVILSGHCQKNAKILPTMLVAVRTRRTLGRQNLTKTHCRSCRCNAAIRAQINGMMIALATVNQNHTS